jgi:hypothetical protein
MPPRRSRRHIFICAADSAARFDDFVVEPLVVSFALQLVEVFVDRAPQMGFTKENRAIRCFAFE